MDYVYKSPEELALERRQHHTMLGAEDPQAKKDQAEAKQREENRLANQVQFDPKIHGVGTRPAFEASEIQRLHNRITALEGRVMAMEGAIRSVDNRPASSPVRPLPGNPASDEAIQAGDYRAR
jgi:hypothetical protein